MQRSRNQNYQPGFVEDPLAGGLSLGYEFDAVGNLFKLRDANQSDPPLRKYEYDALDRLTASRNGSTDALLQGYGYDATGNRTSATQGGIYHYDGSSHRLNRIGLLVRNYDAAGNTTAIGGSVRQFVYDARGRMSQAKQGGVVTMNYAYNGKGEQVRRYLVGNSTYTVYDESGHWLGDYTSTGAPIQQAIWLDDLPVGLAVGSGNQLHYIEPDALGTPRVVIDPVRDVTVWTWDLADEAFGNSAPDENPDGDANNFVFNMRFPGQRYDAASGLNYNYFRDYEPGTGRYVESDPIGLTGGTSTYSYALSRPLTRYDAQGLLAYDYRCTSAQRAYINSEIVRLSSEIQRQALDDCDDGQCDLKAASEAMEFISKRALIGCRQIWACASAVVLLDQVHFYGPYIGAPDSSAISNPKECGCFRGAIFHEALHHVRPEYEEDKIRRESRKCVSCAGDLTEGGAPL